ncbi:diguanylate cyclase domain-containing protein [Vibrio breoganii]|uniref:diguanylate cyclase domain-containing protein n=1 Tax=Vibrio breoganii TaxID=553239 RepID=UPI0021C33FC8|nr:diguanylate cyclase [Vibrio breoganii]MDN3716849.1 diguanylate cyclase [Vibrio breoganii]
MTIKNKLKLLLGTLFFFSMANIGFIYFLESRSENKLQWVIHTNEVMQTSGDLLNAISDAETGQRGYLLTGQSYYLEPYFRSRDEIKSIWGDLKSLTSDNPQQQELLDELVEDIDSKLEELAFSISLYNEQPAEAIEMVRTNVGKKYMDNIRRNLSSFNAEEKRLLEERKGDYREARAYITMMIVIETIVMLFLAFFTVVTVNRTLFNPLTKLMDATQKVEQGKRQDVVDYLPRDEIGYLMGRFYKMSESVHQRHSDLHTKAHTDELTGVYNRITLYSDIEEAIAYSQLDEKVVALCFIDMDGFKDINDQLGHEYGDILLQTVAQRLKETVRSSDRVYRYGGDEFVVLLPMVRYQEDVSQIVSNLVDSIRKPISHKGQHIEVRFSIGVSVAPADTSDPSVLVDNADKAMYRSKQAKQGKVELYSA